MFLMSIHKLQLPINSKKILWNTKKMCFQYALLDVKRRMYKFKQKKEILEKKILENFRKANFRITRNRNKK